MAYRGAAGGGGAISLKSGEKEGGDIQELETRLMNTQNIVGID